VPKISFDPVRETGLMVCIIALEGNLSTGDMEAAGISLFMR
jgi:hypothetical protein